VAVVVIGYGIGLALRPVDLSAEGSVVQAALLIGGWILGGARRRREINATQVAVAERRAARDRERAAYAATEERLRISRELHDVLGHAFSVMVVQAGVAEHLIDSDPADARRALAEIRATGRTSMTEMRRLLQGLREGDDGDAPARDPAPTPADVAGLVARVRAAGLPVELSVDGTPAALSPGLELAAYRVIQEALTNSIKHARASQARVRVTHAGPALTLEIRDDGPAVTATADGHGIAGMRERVAMYGGEPGARSTPDGYLVPR
jgi:signal transduction histidine kinase